MGLGGLWDTTMCEYFSTLLRALEAVKLENCAIFKDTDNKNYELINERSFAYELYRVWNCLNLSKLKINAEVTKEIGEAFKEKATELFGMEHERFLPDMVLHHSQSDSDQQEIICEIKLTEKLDKDSLEKDLKKLYAYTTQNIVLYHPFKLGVFISVGGTWEDVVNKIYGVSNEAIHQLKKSKIIIVNAQIHEQKFIVKYKSLNRLLKNLTQDESN